MEQPSVRVPTSLTVGNSGIWCAPLLARRNANISSYWGYLEVRLVVVSKKADMVCGSVLKMPHAVHAVVDFSAFRRESMIG